MSPISALFPPIQQFPDVYKLPFNACIAPDGTTFPVSVNGFGVIQVLFLIFVYSGAVLKGSVMIAEGGELLLLIPSVAPLIGSVILPILGALPDAALVVFSGLGPTNQAQTKINLGIGALAGATVMLLTVPWFLSILGGRVDVVQGHCAYNQRPKLTEHGARFSCYPTAEFWNTGVETDVKAMRAVAGMILVTTIPYVVALGAAFSVMQQTPEAAAQHERAFIASSLALCLFFFVFYLGYHMKNIASDLVFEKFTDKVREQALARGDMTFDAVFYEVFNAEMTRPESPHAAASGPPLATPERMQRVLRHFFHRYDTDKNGTIDATEIRHLLRDLRLPHTKEDADDCLVRMDANRDGVVHFEEFAHFVRSAYRRGAMGRTSNLGQAPHGSKSSGNLGQAPQSAMSNPPASVSEALVDPAMSQSFPRAEFAPPQHSVSEDKFVPPIHSKSNLTDFGDGSSDDEDDKSMPEDLVNLSPKEQRRHIVRRSVAYMLGGLVLVVLFSDPLIDALGNLANIMGISPFYVSFVISPLASNAFEVIASYSFAKRKSSKTISVSFSTLLGATILNNTLVLSVFLIIILARGLVWVFTAETIAVLAVEWISVIVVACRPLQTMRIAVFVLALWPCALALVVILENVAGLK